MWSRDMQADYGKFGVQFGYASSPLLHQGVLYLQNLQGMYTDDPSYVLAVDAKSGKTLWKVDRPHGWRTRDPGLLFDGHPSQGGGSNSS